MRVGSWREEEFITAITIEAPKRLLCSTDNDRLQRAIPHRCDTGPYPITAPRIQEHTRPSSLAPDRKLTEAVTGDATNFRCREMPAKTDCRRVSPLELPHGGRAEGGPWVE